MKVTPRQVEQTVAAIHRAGCLLLESQPQILWNLKEDGTFVTSLDLRVEDLIGASLGSIFPDCRFIGEEHPESWSRRAESHARVILDPIDGTAPFARGLNYFGISLAVLDDLSRPLLAIIHMPGLKKWYVASFEDQVPTRYRVTFQGDDPEISVVESTISIASDWNLEHAYVYVSSDFHRQLDMSGYPGKIRALGATAAHLALLTDHTIDPAAVILTRYKVWDIAAGLALATAAHLEIRNLTSGAVFRFEELFELTEMRSALLVGRPDVLNAVAPGLKILGG